MKKITLPVPVRVLWLDAEQDTDTYDTVENIKDESKNQTLVTEGTLIAVRRVNVIVAMDTVKTEDKVEHRDLKRIPRALIREVRVLEVGPQVFLTARGASVRKPVDGRSGSPRRRRTRGR